MGKQIYFLVEGETEKLLVNYLYLGRIVKVNLWNLKNDKLSPIFRQISNNSKVFVVCDTDSINQVCVNNFIANFHALKKHIGKDNIFLFQQNNNLEDELIYCSSNIKNVKELRLAFNNASGVEQLKRNFIKETNILAKLNSIGFDHTKLWTRRGCNKLHPLQDFMSSPQKHHRFILRPELNK